MLLLACDIYVLILLFFLLTVFRSVVVGMCSSMDFFLWLIIRLSGGWLSMMFTAVVHVTHLNLRILSARCFIIYHLLPVGDCPLLHLFVLYGSCIHLSAEVLLVYVFRVLWSDRL